MGIWSDLPKPLWELIFLGLDNVLDRIRLGCVCKLFRSVALDRQPHRLSRALLMLPPNQKPSETRDFFSLSDSNTYKTHLPQLNGKWCCGSSYGWLFTVDFQSGDINLLNPFSRAQIPLPPLSAFSDPQELRDLTDRFPERNNIWYIVKATISTSPGENNDFIVMVIYTYCWTLAFCRPGDEKWTCLPRVEGPCEDVVYYKGMFYAMTNWGALVAWDLSDANAPKETIIIPSDDDEPLYHRYLVESIRGELLKVCRILERDEEEEDDMFNYRTAGFHVFKLDEEKKRWTWGCLCGQALFLGYNRAICLSNLENPECKPYCIYFTDDNAERYYDNPNGCNDVGVFSSKDGTVEQFYQNPPFWTSPCIWITPTPR